MNPKDNLEAVNITQLDFKKIKKITNIDTDVIPVVIQDINTLKVLMLGYVNQTALTQSLQEKKVVLWSTSKNKLWVKGKTSGNWLELKKAQVNCENNSLIFLVELKGQGACHTKDDDGKYRLSCYYRKLTI